MPNELYENCPCGSGKKIKFCCPRELQSDFLKALELLNSNQRAAAIERCDRALAKVPTQSCFLMVKLAAQLQTGEMEAARETWTRLHESAPKSPVTHAFRVFISFYDGEIDEALSHLQDAMELTPHDAIPWAVRTSLERTILSFIETGHTFPFLQHGHHYDKTVMEHPDQRILSILQRACLDSGVPLVFKQPWIDRLMAVYPEPFRKAELYRDLSIFRWRKVRDRFAEWHAQGQYEPGATAYLALMHALLLEDAEASKLLREFAKRSDVPEHLAAEALLLAHGLDPLGDPATLRRVRIEYVVQDPDALMERLLSDRRVRTMSVDLQQLAAPDEPPPKGAFEIMNSPLPAEMPSHLAELPRLLGGAFLFGRQTDRDARLEVVLTGDETDEGERIVSEIVDGLIAPNPKREEADPLNRIDPFGPRIAVPDLTDPHALREFNEKYVEYTVREYWPNQPHPLLGGKTPKQAVGDPALRPGLLAALIHLEFTPNFDVWSGDYREFWQQFGVQHDLSSWSPKNPEIVWVTRLNPDQLDDEGLWSASVYAAAMGVRRACNQLGMAVLQRPSLYEREEIGELLRVLVDATAPLEMRLKILEGAIQWCEHKNVSPGQFRVRQFVTLVLLNRSEEASATLRILTTKHTQEAETMQMLMQVLQGLGIIGPDGRPIEAPVAAPAEPAAAASGLWTPDQSAAAAASKPGKLWLPGMD